MFALGGKWFLIKAIDVDVNLAMQFLNPQLSHRCDFNLPCHCASQQSHNEFIQTLKTMSLFWWGDYSRISGSLHEALT